MNVYIYEGDSRFTATTPVIEGNGQVSTGKSYSVNYKSGMLIVAYPDANTTTEFSFTYWISGDKQPAEDDEEATGGQDGDQEGDQDGYKDGDKDGDKDGQHDGESAGTNYDGSVNSLLYLIAGGTVILFIIIVLVCLCGCSRKNNAIEIVEDDRNLESGQHLATGSQRQNDTSIELESVE